jgi:hypothetical protein
LFMIFIMLVYSKFNHFKTNSDFHLSIIFLKEILFFISKLYV